jgi:hypothetical protein
VKISVRKGCQIYGVHMEEEAKFKVFCIEYFSVLGEFEDVFGETPGLPPKRDIYFSINVILGATPVSKKPLQDTRYNNYAEQK